jgi:tetratricopeptide (TPR) repeat protein
MAHPTRLLSLAVLSALLVFATQFASSWQPLWAAQGEEAQVSERLRWVGDRFLNGSRAVHPVTHQEPVPLGAAQIPEFFDARDLTQIPGVLGAGDPLRLGTTPELWDLHPANKTRIFAAIAVPSLGRQERLEQERLDLEQQLDDCDFAASCSTQVDVIQRLSNVYFELGEYQEVIDLLEQSLEEARRINSAQLEQDLLDAIQHNLEQNWDFKAAYGDVRNGRLRDLYRRGKITWQEVIEISKVNLFAARKIGDITRQVDSLHGLGWAYRNIASYAESQSLIRRCSIPDQKNTNRYKQ